MNAFPSSLANVPVSHEISNCAKDPVCAQKCIVIIGWMEKLRFSNDFDFDLNLGFGFGFGLD